MQSSPTVSDVSAQTRTTPLFKTHIQLQAKMTEFGGWAMPLSYSSILKEHEYVRNESGIFDICHMGIFEVSGKDAFRSLQRIVTNDIAVLHGRDIFYKPRCNHEGGTVDDILVYREATEKYLLVVNAGTKEKDREWITQHIDGDVLFRDLSDDLGIVSVQGPLSKKILLSVFTEEDGKSLETLGYFASAVLSWNGTECVCSRTGYTGELGYEIIVARSEVQSLFKSLFEAGAYPIGFGARDSLRLEAGYPLYGHELAEDITPLEAGLLWTVKFSKGDFIGSKKLYNTEVTRETIGLVFDGRLIPRHGCEVLYRGRKAGSITSGTYSPTLSMPIALALVEKGVFRQGDEIDVLLRGKPVKGIVSGRRFYKKDLRKEAP